MAARAKFTADRRERLLTLLETGRTVEEACADVEISRTTVNKWVTRGRNGDPDAEAFAARYDQIRQRGDDAASLTPEDLVRRMEKLARDGSFQAIKYLLERAERRGEGDLGDDTGQTDVFTGTPEDQVLDELDEISAARARKAAG